VRFICLVFLFTALCSSIYGAPLGGGYGAGYSSGGDRARSFSPSSRAYSRTVPRREAATKADSSSIIGGGDGTGETVRWDSRSMGADPDQRGRPGHLHGQLFIDGYQFEYGSGRRGSSAGQVGSSIPYGTYLLEGWHSGPIVRDGIRLPFYIYDPATGIQRTAIVIHAGRGRGLGTLGCVALLQKDYHRLKQIYAQALKEGRQLVLRVNRDGSAQIFDQPSSPIFRHLNQYTS
jgi:hypothetical protein